MLIQKKPMDNELRTALMRASEWAREAGELQLSYFRHGNYATDTKANSFDVVTDADRKSERLILDHIARLYPHHSILSEESGAHESDNAHRRWIIDPLDGTTNFSQGLPLFSVSIALEVDGIPTIGVVYAPYLDEMFTAIRGYGAMLNGMPIKCSSKNDLAQAVLSTGMPVDRAENPDNNLDNIARVVNHVRGVRRLGSAALDLCYVGAGFLDGYWELRLHRWDIAAGMLIAGEAGADITNLRPGDPYGIMASTPGLTDNLRRFIR